MEPPTTPLRPLVPPLFSANDQVSKRHGFRHNQTFQPLPPPTGVYPYRLSLEDIVPVDKAAQLANKVVFHAVGDTGGVKNPNPQQIVALHMAEDFQDAANAPSFFYHLGDVVYFNGETSQYYPQFYDAYGGYPAPIVAIPGNHDGDPIDVIAEPSLTAFVENFCAHEHHLSPEAQEVDRDTMTQPNVYWTLVAPLVTIVGLYTNVPEGGRVDDQQAAWLQAELAAAPADRFLIVALHHPAYSADAHHGGSERMGELLDAAFAGASRTPDLVLTAHVHNYQRFSRAHDGRQVPYLVAGAGGYHNLHYMAKLPDGSPLPKPWTPPDLQDVTLENYVEDRYGFLRLTVTPGSLQVEYVTVPRPQESWRNGPVEVADSFTLLLPG